MIYRMTLVWRWCHTCVVEWHLYATSINTVKVISDTSGLFCLDGYRPITNNSGSTNAAAPVIPHLSASFEQRQSTVWGVDQGWEMQCDPLKLDGSSPPIVKLMVVCQYGLHHGKTNGGSGWGWLRSLKQWLADNDGRFLRMSGALPTFPVESMFLWMGATAW